MTDVKIVIIGGGSYQWSPTIIKDILLAEDLAGSTITLHDIDPEPLDIIYKLGRKMVRELRTNATIEKTTILEEALEDADFVILTISTGGLEAMRPDIEIPRKYGIYQSVGDTVGPGGLSRALRNIPVVYDIAKTVERIAPKAVFINYTNPMTTLTRTINKKTSLKTIGLCHELFGTLRLFKEMFSISNENDIKLKAAGINHLSWILDMNIDGEPVFELLRRYKKEKGIPTLPSSGGNRLFAGVRFALFDVFGYFPYPGDRHVAEFFPYFLTDETHRGADYGVELTTIDERQQWYTSAKKTACDMISGAEEIVPEKSQEAVSDIISAIANNKREKHIVNIPNTGQIANLPQDVIVECFAYVEGRNIEPIDVGELPLGILNTLYKHVINQEMTVNAALDGDRRLALQILLNDPLVRNYANAEKMLDEMLFANTTYLPRFFGG